MVVPPIFPEGRVARALMQRPALVELADTAEIDPMEATRDRVPSMPIAPSTDVSAAFAERAVAGSLTTVSPVGAAQRESKSAHTLSSPGICCIVKVNARSLIAQRCF